VRGVSETHIFRLSRESLDLAECTQALFQKVAWAEGGKGRLRHHLGDLLRRKKMRRGELVSNRPTTLLDLSLLHQRRLKAMLRQSETPEEYCKTFFLFLFDRLRPAAYLIEKTPTNIYEIPRIKDIFPYSKLVAIHREGRHVVVSDKYFLALNGRSRSFAERVSHWQRAMEAQLNLARNYDLFCLSYESLLTSPEEQIAELFRYLALEPDRRLIVDMVSRSSFEASTKRKRGCENQTGFYRKGVAGDWVMNRRKKKSGPFPNSLATCL